MLRRRPRLALWAIFSLSHLIVAGGVGLLTLYAELSTAELLRILAVSEGLVLVENIAVAVLAGRLLRPARAWLRGASDPLAARRAWAALVSLPVDLHSHRRGRALFLNIVPISVYIWLELEADLLSLAIILVGVAVVLAYGIFVRFFLVELTARRLLRAVSRELADGAPPAARSLPLRARLLLALPIINVITGVVVAGLSQPGQGTLADLGIDALVAVGVAFTISLELSLLLSRSIFGPIDDLQRATARVAEGDLSTRVPVLSADEAGRLAGSFNRMVAGLAERERLREAFGSYVDPALAERVLSEGVELAGEEVEVSVLFLDIRDFTAFAEEAAPREVVARLNDFFDLVVPVLIRHGGHASKFLGDGVLGVFGAPDRRADHADRAVAAALELAECVRDRYGGRMRIGIGINSGTVVAGTVGGGGRLEFTVIGDPVNTAARVERATRETGDDILVTEATRCLLRRDPGVALEERPPAELRGKSEPVRLWAPVTGRHGRQAQAAGAAAGD